mmetsp:Transcript_34473/g.73447  ORF Transcript_34473/g.73447 Transcript_34473/m.73447 type:complete len:253 (+) Transcript_34473:198-956(+)
MRSRPQSAGPSRGDPSHYAMAQELYSSYSRGSPTAFALQQQQLTKLSQNKTAPKWSFPGRRPSSARSGTPGPGSYEKAAFGANARGGASHFGTSTRDEHMRNASPGPGHYHAAARPRSAAPSYGFGGSARSRDGCSGTPGPGAYSPTISATKQAAAAYTATPRRDGGRRGGDSPGPGAYASAYRQHQAQSFGFGTSERDGLTPGYGPGPGSYSPGRPNHGPAYSMYWRHGQSRGFDTPGPGSHAGMYTQFGY